MIARRGWLRFEPAHASAVRTIVAATLCLLGTAACSRGGAEGGAARVEATEDGFKPSSVTLKKGGSGTVVFTRTTDETCATEVVFPELKLKKALPKGTPVSVDLPTDKEQTLTFQCGMGMYKSSVVIAN